MDFRIKSRLKIAVIVLAAMLSLVSILLLLIFWIGSISTDYTTSDIIEYGNYSGVLQEAQDEYMNRFFPESIQPEFVNPIYHFSSRTVDTYGFEAYLEFTFASQEQYEEHIEKATEGMLQGTFYFDNDYSEYLLFHQNTGNVCDSLWLHHSPNIDDNGIPYYSIDYAGIAKILANPKERRVIYIALGVSDGGGSDTKLLNAYFSRFGIDPIEYEEYTDKIG